MPDLTFLPRAERRAAAMGLAAFMLVASGYKLRDLIGDAQAAEKRVHRLERSVSRMDRNMIKIASKLNVAVDTETDADVEAAGVGQ